jgi:hypothetical protein
VVALVVDFHDFAGDGGFEGAVVILILVSQLLLTFRIPRHVQRAAVAYVSLQEPILWSGILMEGISHRLTWRTYMTGQEE